MVTLPEAAQVLTVAAAFDRRTIGESDAQAWASALADVPVADAIEAVKQHYSLASEWIMPSHVRARAKTIRTDRVARAGHPPFPPELADDPRREALWGVEWRSAVGDGCSPAEATERACRRFNVPQPVAEIEPGRDAAAAVAALAKSLKHPTSNPEKEPENVQQNTEKQAAEPV